MSFLISHPSGYTYVSPTEVPPGFFVKCYPYIGFIDESTTVDEKFIESGKASDPSIHEIKHWEIDYDLPKRSVAGLLRYSRFASFEEAALKCAALGIDCVKCRWLYLPRYKGKDGHWCISWCSVPHCNEVLVPVDRYEEEKERIYRERLGGDYDEYMEMFEKNKSCPDITGILLAEDERCAKSGGFKKRNTGLIRESDLSGYELIGRDCMVTV